MNTEEVIALIPHRYNFLYCNEDLPTTKGRAVPTVS